MTNEKIKHVEDRLNRAKSLSERVKRLDDLRKNTATMRCSLVFQLSGADITFDADLLREIITTGVAEVWKKHHDTFEQMEISSELTVARAVS